jgi:hypothetical protein
MLRSCLITTGETVHPLRSGGQGNFMHFQSAVSCLPLLEPILPTARSDVARSARVVAFTFLSRFEPVVMLNPAQRAEYRALPPSAPAARFHSDFFRGGNSKKEWAAGGRGGSGS